MSYQLNVAQPVVDEDGTMASPFRQFTQEAALSIPVTGSGTPEGVVEDRQFSLYLDTSAGAGAIQYRKMIAEIGGDRKKGWVQTGQSAPKLTALSLTASNTEFIIVTAGSITITLPASPSSGDYVIVKDGTGSCSTNTFTVDRNGSNIASAASDLIFDKDFAQVTMTYINATIGWSV